MEFAYYHPSTFFQKVNKSGVLSSTGVTDFIHPLMFYEGSLHMHLYKAVSGIIYATKIELDVDGNIANSFGTGPEEMESDVLLGTSIDSLRLKLMNEFSGEEILAPLDSSKLLEQHNHNQHTHAGSGFNDIQT